MRISSGLSGAPQENMYDGITILGTISEGRFFRVLKARMGTKHIILKSAVHKDAMTTEFLRREFELGITLSHSCVVTTLGFEEDTPAGAVSDIYSIGLLIRQMSGSKYRRIIDRCGSHIRSVCADHDSSLKSGNCRHRVIPQCPQRPPEDRNEYILRLYHWASSRCSTLLSK